MKLNANIKNGPSEIWKDIEGFEGMYQISNHGKVKSLRRLVSQIVHGIDCPYWLRERLLRGGSTCGYHTVVLCKDSVKTGFRVNRLVAQYFIERVPGKEWVNHIDGNKQNNHISNLEWCTPSENNLHALKTGLRKSPKGEDRVCSKLTNNQIDEIRSMFDTTKLSNRKICKLYDVSHATISAIRTGRTWSHHKKAS